MISKISNISKKKFEKKYLKSKRNRKVRRDYCYYSGKYRGFAHSMCN